MTSATVSVPSAAGPFKSLSATEAAFAGLNVLRRRPMVLLVWAVALLVFGLLVGVCTVATIGPQLMQMQAMGAQRGLAGGAVVDPAAGAAMFGRLLPFYGLLLLGTLAFYSAAYAAVDRALLRPEQGGPGYFSFGADELRQGACMVLTGLVLIGIYFGGALVVGLVAGIAVAVLHVAGMAVAGLAGLGLLALLVWMSVRLSLAGALTFDTRRVRLFGSFALTRGHFWKLLGTYLLALALAVALYLVLVIVLGALSAVLGGGIAGLGALFRPDTSSIAGYFTPLILLNLIGVSLIGPIQLFCLIGAPAAAYGQLRRGDLAEVF